MTTAPLPLERFPIHLGRRRDAAPEPEFTGVEWYAGYMERHAGDGMDGRLVAMHSFRESWPAWEMHPAGEEIVLCTAGELVLIQELPDGQKKTRLRAGEYAINPRGVWHTADIEEHATAVFITPAAGTDHRSR